MHVLLYGISANVHDRIEGTSIVNNQYFHVFATPHGAVNTFQATEIHNFLNFLNIRKLEVTSFKVGARFLERKVAG